MDSRRQQKTGEAMAMYRQMGSALAAILLGSVHILLREIFLGACIQKKKITSLMHMKSKFKNKSINTKPNLKINFRLHHYNFL